MSGTTLFVPEPPAHEIMGWWYVPIALVLGSLLILLTTFVIQRSLRISQTIQTKLALMRETVLAR